MRWSRNVWADGRWMLIHEFNGPLVCKDKDPAVKVVSLARWLEVMDDGVGSRT